MFLRIGSELKKLLRFPSSTPTWSSTGGVNFPIARHDKLDPEFLTTTTQQQRSLHHIYAHVRALFHSRLGTQFLNTEIISKTQPLRRTVKVVSLKWLRREKLFNLLELEACPTRSNDKSMNDEVLSGGRLPFLVLSCFSRVYQLCWCSGAPTTCECVYLTKPYAHVKRGRLLLASFGLRVRSVLSPRSMRFGSSLEACISAPHSIHTFWLSVDDQKHYFLLPNKWGHQVENRFVDLFRVATREKHHEHEYGLEQQQTSGGNQAWKRLSTDVAPALLREHGRKVCARVAKCTPGSVLVKNWVSVRC